MKNLTLILLTAFLATFLFSCNSGETASENETEIQSLDSISATLDKSAEELNQKTKDVENTVDDLLKEFE